MRHTLSCSLGCDWLLPSVALPSSDRRFRPLLPWSASLLCLAQGQSPSGPVGIACNSCEAFADACATSSSAGLGALSCFRSWGNCPASAVSLVASPGQLHEFIATWVFLARITPVLLLDRPPGHYIRLNCLLHGDNASADSVFLGDSVCEDLRAAVCTVRCSRLPAIYMMSEMHIAQVY